MSDIDHNKLREEIDRVRAWTSQAHFVSHTITKAGFDLLCDAAESTLPKTKEVEVWRTEYAANGLPSIINWYTREAAEGWAEGAKGLAYIDCIRVTGPHKQSIPA